MRVLLYCPAHNVSRWESYAVALGRRCELYFVTPSYAKVGKLNREHFSVEGISTLPIEPLLRHAALDVPNPIAMRSLLRLIEPDVVHIMGEPCYCATYVMVTASGKRDAQVVTCRAAQNVAQGWPFPLSYFESVVYEAIDSIFTVSKGAEEVLHSKGYRGRMKRIPNGFDPELFNWDGTTSVCEPIKLLFVGKLIRRKAPLLLLEALQGLKHLPWKLDIVGEGDLAPEVQSFISREGLDARIAICGNVPQVDLAKMYSDADVLVLPSRRSSGSDWGPLGKYISGFGIRNEEQFGMVIVEAQACGCVCVGSSCGAIPEVIGNGGWVFQEDSVEDLKRLLCSVLTEPERLEKGIPEAVANADQYSIEVVASRSIEEWARLARLGKLE